MDRKVNSNYVVTLYAPPTPPVVRLLCAYSDLTSSLHRQEKARERKKTRGISIGIAIAKSSPPPKSANNKLPTAKVSQHYPKSHLSVLSLHYRATGTSSLSL